MVRAPGKRYRLETVLFEQVRGYVSAPHRKSPPLKAAFHNENDRWSAASNIERQRVLAKFGEFSHKERLVADLLQFLSDGTPTS